MLPLVGYSSRVRATVRTGKHLLTSAWFTFRPVRFAVAAGGDKNRFRGVSELLKR